MFLSRDCPGGLRAQLTLQVPPRPDDLPSRRGGGVAPKLECPKNGPSDNGGGCLTPQAAVTS